jgi:asparagine synthase (glutamine-hydrolysing)
VRAVNAATDDRFGRIEEWLGLSTPEGLHQYCSSRWKKPSLLVPGTIEHQTAFTDSRRWASSLSATERMMYVDLVNYLPEDIFTKLDRSTMAASLEGRVPFLDPHVVEFAWRLPLEFKIHNQQGKRILRNILSRYVPRPLFERPKMGFNLPLRQWLRGPLRPWAEELLAEPRLRRDGLLEPAPVRQTWNAYLNGDDRPTTPLWGLLMFQAWHDEWMTRASKSATRVA